MDACDIFLALTFNMQRRGEREKGKREKTTRGEDTLCFKQIKYQIVQLCNDLNN
jgi:hypothetical protein